MLTRFSQSLVGLLARKVPYKSPPLWRGQLVAVLCVAAGASFRFLIDPLVHGHLPVAAFYPFVLIASVWGGAFSGLSTLAITAAISDYFWLPPTGSFELTATSAVPLVAFSLFGGFAILLIGLLRTLLEAHVQAEERAKLLAHEMQHRANNLFGMVRAISVQTARNAASVADFQTLFTARLAALARAQQLVTENRQSPPDLKEFLRYLLEPFGADRFLIDGPKTSVPPYLGTCCALLFHELATNATKYGALSVPGGMVVINWEMERTLIRLNWREIKGPAVVAPVRVGFGSRLLKTAFPPQYGDAAIIFNPDGVHCTVNIALV